MTNQTPEIMIAEALRVDVHNGDGWLSDAQGANLHVGSGGEVYFSGDGSVDVQHAAGLAVAALRAANLLRDDAWLTEYTRVKQAEAWERAWREIRSIPRWWNTEDQYGEFDMQPLGPNETTEQGAYMAVREVMTNNPYRKGGKNDD